MKQPGIQLGKSPSVIMLWKNREAFRPKAVEYLGQISSVLSENCILLGLSIHVFSIRNFHVPEEKDMSDV